MVIMYSPTTILFLQNLSQDEKDGKGGGDIVQDDDADEEEEEVEEDGNAMDIANNGSGSGNNSESDSDSDDDDFLNDIQDAQLFGMFLYYYSTSASLILMQSICAMKTDLINCILDKTMWRRVKCSCTLV